MPTNIPQSPFDSSVLYERVKAAQNAAHCLALECWCWVHHRADPHVIDTLNTRGDLMKTYVVRCQVCRSGQTVFGDATRQAALLLMENPSMHEVGCSTPALVVEQIDR